jgi:SAM-dependent methyltransferase
VLDYGCGGGQVIALGLKHGLDIWGADTYSGWYAGWVPPQKVRDRIRIIYDGKADFPDGHFDLIISNQVLEHVTDPEAVIADVFRMLKPGGRFIAAFPVTETWYEGHVGLYFAHRFRRGSRARRDYFSVCHRLGQGLYRDRLTGAEWVTRSEQTLDDACYYYPRRRMVGALEAIFQTVEDIATDYMRARLGSRARYIPAIANPALRFIYHKRAGEIFRATKGLR